MDPGSAHSWRVQQSSPATSYHIVEQQLPCTALKLQETKRPRMTSGESGLHVTRWARHCFSFATDEENQGSACMMHGLCAAPALQALCGCF